ncbi:hypothetical protein L0664_00125 [Octadecabacter sp. G9-8]|uniref:Sulfotransferase family protein n=1 Tax=Octadecabacter dasysiphoniae TaxID=2909341 RepID=A0ABS9CQK8_9RHOB|nr:hypothetical protein [Octadecabacter dasysiphoniae]MCF2869458.1 hypothetical protein [Octadecabacter dasysiphoniae]
MEPAVTSRYFILGASRSGSSIVELALADLTSATALGEVRWVYKRGIQDNDICGCGQDFADCDFWQGTITEDVRENAKDLDHLRATFDNPLKLFAAKYGAVIAPRLAKDYSAYTAELRRLYASIDAACDGPIIDNSKRPYYSIAVADALCTDVGNLVFVHVVRNSIDVVRSWANSKVREESQSKEMMPSYCAAKAIVFWTIYVFSQLLIRLYFLRKSHFYLSFDDLKAASGQLSVSIDGVTQDVALGEMYLDKVDYHSVSGNPDRSRWAGGVSVRPSKARSKTIKEWIWYIPLSPALLANAVLKALCRSSLPISSGASQGS